MLRSGIVYVPASPVFVAVWIPVPSFKMTSSALGTTCPLESVTVPVMVPRSPCAKRPVAVKPDKTNHTNRFRVMISTSSARYTIKRTPDFTWAGKLTALDKLVMIDRHVTCQLISTCSPRCSKARYNGHEQDASMRIFVGYGYNERDRW